MRVSNKLLLYLNVDNSMSGIQIPEDGQGKVVVTDIEYEECSPDDTNWEECMILTPQVSNNWPRNEHPNGAGVRKSLDGNYKGINRVKTDNGEVDLAIRGKLYITAEPV